MSKNPKNVKTLIRILKEIDSNIDLARDKFQIDILISAAEDKPFSLTELAEKLGISRKSLADAVQKLKNKKIVKKLGRDKYTLSEKGLKIRRTLAELATSTKTMSESIYDIFHIIMIILTLGTLEREWVPLSTLAKHLHEDKSRIEKLVKDYSNEKILKVREGVTGLELALTFEGRNLYNNILDDMGVGAYSLKVLKIVTGSPSPFQALKRFLLINLLFGTTTLIISLFTRYALIAVAAWIMTSLYVMILIYSKT